MGGNSANSQGGFSDDPPGGTPRPHKPTRDDPKSHKRTPGIQQADPLTDRCYKTPRPLTPLVSCRNRGSVVGIAARPPCLAPCGNRRSTRRILRRPPRRHPETPQTNKRRPEIPQADTRNPTSGPAHGSLLQNATTFDTAGLLQESRGSLVGIAGAPCGNRGPPLWDLGLLLWDLGGALRLVSGVPTQILNS